MTQLTQDRVKKTWKQRLDGWAKHKHAGLFLLLIAFFESWIFPIPPDILLLALVLGKPQSWARWAAICTLGSVIGGVFGYIIGAWLYETLGLWLVQSYGFEAELEHFRQVYADWGVWIILIKGLTPIPYKLVTIASGLAGFDFVSFIILSLLTRGLRFFIVSYLTYRFGPQISATMARYQVLSVLILIGCVVGGFAVVFYL